MMTLLPAASEEDGSTLRETTVWIDLAPPTPADEQALELALGIPLPTEEDIVSTQPSSRLYREKGVLYLAANILACGGTGPLHTAHVGFVLTERHLITLRKDAPRALEHFREHARQQPSLLPDASTAFVHLLEAVIDTTADILEKTGAQLGSCGQRIFRRAASTRRKGRNAGSLERAIQEIATLQQQTGALRESLVSLERMLAFAGQFPPFHGTTAHEAAFRALRGDIAALTDQAGFIMSNLTFMLDACLGLIDIEQNGIIKIFSVMSVLFLPPTLVASVYGMNFAHMPELANPWGYPAAIAGMLLSAVLPFWYFRHRRWL